MLEICWDGSTLVTFKGINWMKKIKKVVLYKTVILNILLSCPDSPVVEAQELTILSSLHIRKSRLVLFATLQKQKLFLTFTFCLLCVCQNVKGRKKVLWGSLGYIWETQKKKYLGRRIYCTTSSEYIAGQLSVLVDCTFKIGADERF